jgi:hypothetical protein
VERVGFRVTRLSAHVTAAAVLAGAVWGCEPRVVSSAVPTSAAQLPVPARPVKLASLAVPGQARELGIVQAHSNQTDISKLIPEFVSRVAGLGGDLGKIDDITTTYEMRTVTSTQSYSCGTPSAPMTCTRMVTNTVEVPTTRILGRAFAAAPQSQSQSQ